MGLSMTIALIVSPPLRAQTETGLVPNAGDIQPDAAEFEARIVTAFRATHDGYSVDEVLIQSNLQSAFVAACWTANTSDETATTTIPDAFVLRCNRTLLQLRKRGALGPVATRRAPAPAEGAPPTSAYRFAAEIAARESEDQRQHSIDDALTDPVARRAFLNAARRVLSGGDDADESSADEPSEFDADRSASHDTFTITDDMLLREALRLRKQRELRPELVARIADWGRTVTVYELADLRADLSQVPEVPGVYLFRDATGYLYIGEAANLRTRLTDHVGELGGSDRQALASYLEAQGNDADITVEFHAFDPQSNARRVGHRRAYESSLIASREPRFNVRP